MVALQCSQLIASSRSETNSISSTSYQILQQRTLTSFNCIRGSFQTARSSPYPWRSIQKGGRARKPTALPQQSEIFGTCTALKRWKTLPPCHGRAGKVAVAFSYNNWPLVPASDHWGIWTALLTSAAAGLWLERKTTLGRALSAPLVSTLIGLLLSNGGIIPSEAPAYSVVNKFLMPLAIPLLLLRADLRRVFRETGRVLVAFCIGSVGTIIGTFVALTLCPLRSLGSEGWKIAAALMSRHIGGAVNYVSVCEALGVSPSIVASGLAADNLICAVYFSTLFLLSSRLVPLSAKGSGDSSDTSGGSVDVHTGSIALAFAAFLAYVGVKWARSLGWEGAAIACATAATVAVASLFPELTGSLSGSGEGISVILMQIFFAAVGANGSVESVVRNSPIVFLFCFVQIAIHLAFTLGVGYMFQIGPRELLIGSNANVGGPSTAGGMAKSKAWVDLMVPAVLVGVFGYSIATFLSLFVGMRYFRFM